MESKNKLCRYILYALFLFAHLSSCKHEFNLNQTDEKNEYPTLTEMQSLYEELSTDSLTKFTIQNKEFSFSPKWSERQNQKINDSTVYSIIPLHVDGVVFENQTNFLLFKNKEELLFGRFVVESSEKIDHKTNFLYQGDLTLTNIINNNTSFYHYSKGKGKALTTGLKKGINKSSINKSLSISSTGECEMYQLVITCDWAAFCPETGTSYLRTSPLGTCFPPSDVRCGKNWIPYYQRAPIIQEKCVKYKDPEPPFWTGGGGGQSSIPTSFLNLGKLNADQKKALDTALTEMKNHCVLSNLLKKLNGTSITFNPKPNASNYNSEERAVELDEGGLSTVELVAHELFHAFQHQKIYLNSFKIYGRDREKALKDKEDAIKNNTNPKYFGEPGYINIEFERMVFLDICKFYSEEREYVGSSFRGDWGNPKFEEGIINYQSWIKTIAESGIDLKSPDISKLADFKDNYLDFLQFFKEYSPLSYAKTDIKKDLLPQALISFFNGTKQCP